MPNPIPISISNGIRANLSSTTISHVAPISRTTLDNSNYIADARLVNQTALLAMKKFDDDQLLYLIETGDSSNHSGIGNTITSDSTN